MNSVKGRVRMVTHVQVERLDHLGVIAAVKKSIA